MELEQIRELMRIFDAANVTELVLEAGDERVVLRKGPAGPMEGVTAADQTVAAGPARQAANREVSLLPQTSTAADATQTHTITSPMVATFYRAAAPGAQPFVSVGDHVTEGQVLCILECMKVMNHMEAEVSGRVREILAENGASVEYGQPLFVIEADR